VAVHKGCRVLTERPVPCGRAPWLPRAGRRACCDGRTPS